MLWLVLIQKTEINPKLSLTSNRLDTNLHEIGLSDFPNKKTVPRSHLPICVELASALEVDHCADLDQLNQLLPEVVLSEPDGSSTGSRPEFLNRNHFRDWSTQKLCRIKEGVKKKTYLFGTLSRTSDPTHPPRTFGTPLSEK